jgi:hypothetical protein
MTWSTEQRSLIRSILITILTLSISCYCVGAMVLLGSQALRPGQVTTTPTQITPTGQPSPSITWLYVTATPSITPSITPTWTPSVTFTPFLTPTPTNTRTSTITPLPSSTFTAIATSTASLTPVLPPIETSSPVPTKTTPAPSATIAATATSPSSTP